MQSAHSNASESEVVLRASSLFKRFGDAEVVNNLSLSVRRGQCVGLLGPNGAGKTTTLAILAGLSSPSLGSVSVAGEKDPRHPSVRRQIGLVPQDLALYPALTVRENLQFFAHLHGLSGGRKRERIQFALELAALTKRPDSTVQTLSGGMQRRLNLACSTLHDPAVLLLDEPTVGVDPHSRQHLFECVRQLKREGKAIVYSTHYMEEVEALCDWVTIVDNGQVVTQGTPRELLDRHGGSTVLRARLDAGADLELPQLASHVTDEGWLSLSCTDVRQGLDVLLGLKVELGELHIERARLEDVVLSLTGRNLRDS